MRLVTEAPESPTKPHTTPHDRAQTGHMEAIEQLADAALAYFANPSPELFELCQVACAVVSSRRSKVG